MPLSEEHKARLGRGADVPVTETAEFKAAVEQAVEAGLQRILAQLEASHRREDAQPFTPDDSETRFARVLSAQLAELIDDDRRRTGKAARLSGEELEARREARERMEQLLVAAFAEGKEPQYDVMRPMYLEEQLVEPTWQNAQKVLMRRQILWFGIPNEYMAPANDTAREIHETFIRSIGGSTAPINRPDLGRPKLKVIGSSDVDGVPAVGKPGNIGMLKLLGDTIAGQITETAVLGTIAAPARQLA